jgi:membrane-bound lytic murein transglycosylase A
MKPKMFHSSISIILPVIAITLIMTACRAFIEKPTDEVAMTRTTAFFYPDFTDDLEYDGLEHSMQQSISYLRRIPADRMFVFGKDRFEAAHMIRSLQQFLGYIQTKPSARDLEKFIRSNFWVYRSIGRDRNGEVLFTGYYEPYLKGSLYPNKEYRFPIYSLPKDLIKIDLSPFAGKYAGEKIIGRFIGETVVPYYDRREIDYENVLEGKSGPLVWLKDPVDVFFLQIQGSGKVFLDNGQVINVHYIESNGRPYRSIGKLLIEKKKIAQEQMSMQKIRSYLREHPEDIAPILNHNPSYVFFKIEPEGPLGSLEIKLTPGRSIALDQRIFPAAALAFIKTKKPVVDSTGQIDSWIDCTRFVLNHDTGGAIRGPGRADLFWGNGPYAEIAAGHLAHTGRLYFLVLKPQKAK